MRSGGGFCDPCPNACPNRWSGFDGPASQANFVQITASATERTRGAGPYQPLAGQGAHARAGSAAAAVVPAATVCDRLRFLAGLVAVMSLPEVQSRPYR